MLTICIFHFWISWKVQKHSNFQGLIWWNQIPELVVKWVRNSDKFVKTYESPEVLIGKISLFFWVSTSRTPIIIDGFVVWKIWRLGKNMFQKNFGTNCIRLCVLSCFLHLLCQSAQLAPFEIWWMVQVDQSTTETQTATRKKGNRKKNKKQKNRKCTKWKQHEAGTGK